MELLSSIANYKPGDAVSLMCPFCGSHMTGMLKEKVISSTGRGQDAYYFALDFKSCECPTVIFASE